MCLFANDIAVVLALPVAVVLIWISIIFFIFLRTLQKERGVSARN